MSAAQPPTGTGATMPVGPWLLVVGMHRSGTSAVTGALGELGLEVPVLSDRFEASEDNPDHYESRALGIHDDNLLQRLGGTWDGPPNPDPGWESDPDHAEAELGQLIAAAGEAFPAPGPVAFKDPRICLLLPHWLAHLPRPLAAVFVWRSPLAVARSLRVRDHMALADGVALWERYNRAGLADLAGIDTYVVRYESVVADPAGQLGAVATWLGGLPQFAPHAPQWDLTRAEASITPQLRRQQDAGDDDLLLPEQRRLVDHLESLAGGHGPLTVPLPGPESSWTTALLDDRRLATVLRDTLDDHIRAAEVLAEEVFYEMKTARLKLEGTKVELANMYALYESMKASTSWRVTRPIRQVVALRNRNSTPSGPATSQVPSQPPPETDSPEP